MKDLVWVASALKDLRGLPEEVKNEAGYALYQAQLGVKHPDAKPLRGFGGARVLEIVINEDGDTYRVVYTTKLEQAIYVLHAFAKKARRGRKTPDHEMTVIKLRLAAAEEHAKGEVESK